MQTQLRNIAYLNINFPSYIGGEEGMKGAGEERKGGREEGRREEGRRGWE